MNFYSLSKQMDLPFTIHHLPSPLSTLYSLLYNLFSTLFFVLYALFFTKRSLVPQGQSIPQLNRRLKIETSIIQ